MALNWQDYTAKGAKDYEIAEAAEKHMIKIVDLIDEVIENFNDEAILENVGKKVIKMMKRYPIYPKVQI